MLRQGIHLGHQSHRLANHEAQEFHPSIHPVPRRVGGSVKTISSAQFREPSLRDLNPARGYFRRSMFRVRRKGNVMTAYPTYTTYPTTRPRMNPWNWVLLIAGVILSAVGLGIAIAGTFS